MSSVVQNTHASAPTKETLQSSAPSNRTRVREIGSLVETNSVRIDRAPCESLRPPRQASPRGMREDCFRKQGAATSSRDASFAKPLATRVRVSCLRRLGHTGESRQRATSAASCPELVPNAEKGEQLYRDTGNLRARRGQRFRQLIAH